MQRLGMKIDKGIFRLSLGAYFAVGTNTVQFGAHLDLKASVKVAKIKGYLSFDALFIFNPFRFEVAIKAGVALSAFGVNLLAVALAFNFSGTSPWRVKGKASVKILFWKVKANFNVSWGDKAKEIAPEVTQLFPIFMEVWNDARNWKALASDYNDKLVMLMETPKDDLVIHPLQGFSFEQDRIPLNQSLDSYGKTLPADYKNFRFNPESVRVGSNSGRIQISSTNSLEKALFIPADFIQMSNEDKLAAPSFVDMDSGFTYKSSDEKLGNTEEKDIDYFVDADSVTLVGSKLIVQADENAEEKTITKKEIQSFIEDKETPFGANYQDYGRQEKVALVGTSGYQNLEGIDELILIQQEYENQQRLLLNELISKQDLESNYKLYNKTTHCFETSGSYAQVLNRKNELLKERGLKTRSTDLVVMVE